MNLHGAYCGANARAANDPILLDSARRRSQNRSPGFCHGWRLRDLVGVLLEALFMWLVRSSFEGSRQCRYIRIEADVCTGGI